MRSLVSAIVDPPPRLDVLRRLEAGFRLIRPAEFGQLVNGTFSFDEYARFRASPLSYCGEPEHEPEHVEKLIRLAWELGR